MHRRKSGREDNKSVLELRAWLAPTRVVVNRSHFDADLTLTDERVKRRLGRIVEELIEFPASNPPIPMPG